MRRKRRSRGHRGTQKRAAKINLAPVILILGLSVGCGYAAAKYVVDPVVNYVPQIVAEKEQAGESDSTVSENTASESESSQPSIVEGEASVEETGEILGYALQFGCYSGQMAAEAVMGTIGVEDLQILEQNGMYKIVGEIYDTKEKAKAALDALPDTADAFVATIYK